MKKTELQERNIKSLNGCAVLNLLISRTNNDVNGNPRYIVRDIAPLGEYCFAPSIFAGLVDGRVTNDGVVIKDHRGIQVAAAEFEGDLRVTGVTVPVKWFVAQ